MEGTPLSHFPKTVRDAITITRALGFKFLWVDAFCIYQDSKMDWEIEAPKMPAIYSEATLCLAAADSSSVHQGIFTEREVDGEAIRCSLPWWSHTPTRIYESVRLRPFQSTTFEITDPTAEGSPLTARGWTMQERMLSWRVLTYTSKEISWSCPSCISGERGKLKTGTFPSERTYAFPNFYSWKYLVTQNANMSNQTPDEDRRARNSIYRGWYNIVRDYSHRKLTKPSDRLPAIGGIAETISKDFGSSYVAGLWKEDLICGLLWNFDGLDLGPQHISLEFLSWNWISLNDRISFPCAWNRVITRRPIENETTSCLYWELAQLVDINLTYSSQSTFGSLISGELIITAPSYQSDTIIVDDMDEDCSPFLRYLRQQLAVNPEYHQRHRSFDGQQVAVLQIVWVVDSPYRMYSDIPCSETYLLILESVEKK